MRTKGKWSYTSQKGTKGHCFVAQIWTDLKEECVVTVNTTEKESEANANVKLIAVAPEMLEMLERCSHWIANCNEDAGILKQIEQLIKKATL